jgi:hypothetical protein
VCPWSRVVKIVELFGMIGAVGFWGTFVMHRGEQLLWELLPEISELGDAELLHDGVGGWQVTRVYASLDSLPVDFLAKVRERTTAPVLAADVLDSDAAFVTALGRQTPGWQGWLQLDRALGHLVPPPSPFDEDGNHLGDDRRSPDHEREVAAVKARILGETPGGLAAATAAVQWATEAGLQPGSRNEVREALTSEALLVEDVFFDLLNRLGFATDECELPSAPTIVEVLRALLGRTLEAVRTTPHRSVRGERLTYPDMLDLRMDFDGPTSVAACGCNETFQLLPAPPTDRYKASSLHAEQLFAAQVSEIAGRKLTDAGTVRYRNFPDLRGVVLRFDDAVLFVAAVQGRWTVVNGFMPPAQIVDGEELRLNNWLFEGGQQR